MAPVVAALSTMPDPTGILSVIGAFALLYLIPPILWFITGLMVGTFSTLYAVDYCDRNPDKGGACETLTEFRMSIYGPPTPVDYQLHEPINLLASEYAAPTRYPGQDYVTVKSHADGFMSEHIYFYRNGHLFREVQTGLSFWLTGGAFCCVTIFLLWEAGYLCPQVRPTIHVAAVICLIASITQYTMREYWIDIAPPPVYFRYVDWFMTIPLQMVEFYLILDATGKLGLGGRRPGIAMFYRLVLGSLIMLGFFYAGQTGQVDERVGLVCGCVGWAYLLYEIHCGEARWLRDCIIAESICDAFDNMRFIVTFGFSVYPLVYYFGSMMAMINIDTMNWIYNAADFFNKMLFVLCIWEAGFEEKSLL